MRQSGRLAAAAELAKVEASVDDAVTKGRITRRVEGTG